MPASERPEIAAGLSQAVRDAGDLALTTFNSALKHWTKGKDSPVSEADIAVDNLLRERLRTNSAGKAKLPLLEIVALFFKAWIAYQNGKQVKCLRWNNGGANPEKFPEI